MRVSLRPHPQTPCEAVDAIAVDLERRGRRLRLSYVVLGRCEQVRIPPLGQGGRRDELWKTTCFEAFIRPETGQAYVEINLAPSGDWATYRFGGYRDGMRAAHDLEPDLLRFSREPERLQLDAGILLMDADAEPWRVGLTAVIEEAGGRKSYWALAHPPGAPDFHHADGFVIELPPV